MNVSLETVRRDVRPLVGAGDAPKMQGAIGLPALAGETPFERRMRENANEKRRIARAVVATIQDGVSIGAVDAVIDLDYCLREAELARMALSRGARRSVVTDHTKFGRQGLVPVCGMDGFHEMFTDRPLPHDIQAAPARPARG